MTAGQIFATLWQWLLRFAAGFVIVLALLVGVARLLLPEASRFADDVRRVAQEATGFEVDFALLSAGVTLYGPELRLADVSVDWPGGEPAFAAREIGIAVDLYRLATRGEVVPSLVHVEGVAVDVAFDETGELRLQDRLWQEYLRGEEQAWTVPDLRVSLEDIEISFSDEKRGIQPLQASVQQLFATLDNGQLEVEADVVPEEEIGGRLRAEALLPLRFLTEPGDISRADRWRLQLRVDDFRLDPWLRLAEFVTTPVIDTEGTAELSVEFAGLEPRNFTLVADIDELVLAQEAGEPLVYDRLAGDLSWRRDGNGWRARGVDVRLERDGRSWPASLYDVRFDELEDGFVSVAADASFARLDDIMPLLQAFAAEQLAEAGIGGNAAGDIWNFKGELTLQQETPGGFVVESDFDDLGYLDPAREIDVAGISGQVRATTDGGTLTLSTESGRLGWGVLFRRVIEVDALEGLAVWRAGRDGFRVIANDLYVRTPDGEGTASLELQSDNEFANPLVDLTARASMDNAVNIGTYLPNTVPAEVLDWIDKAVVSGRSDNTEFRLQGPLRKFPFRGDEGTFLIDIAFEDGGLEFAPGWPAVEKARGRLVFENESLYSVENVAEIGGLRVRNAAARIADLKEAEIRIEAGGEAGVPELLGFLRQTPVARQLGEVFDDVRGSGSGNGQVRFVLPLREMRAWQLDGTLDIVDASAWLEGLDPRLTGITGQLTLANTRLSADRLTAALLGEPVEIRVEASRGSEPAFGHRALLRGELPYAKIEAALGLPPLGKFSGSTEVKAAAMFPSGGPNSRPFRLLVHSDLVGVSSTLPDPLRKEADTREDFDAEVSFPQSGRIDVRTRIGRGLTSAIVYMRRNDRWGLENGLVRLGTDAPARPGENGLAVVAYMERLSLAEWLAAFDQPAADAAALEFGRRGRWQDLFESAELVVSDLQVAGFSFPDTDVRIDFGASAWDVEMAGPWLQGTASVPYEVAERAVVQADLERLLLIESLEGDGGDEDEYAISPLDLPGFRVTADEFALATLRLGALEADIEATADGLETNALRMRAPAFDIDVTGDWELVDSAQRSRLRLELASRDVLQTLEWLGFAPLIEAGSAEVTADLIWEGPPGIAALNESTGQVSMTISEGSILEVDAGGGRLLGMLSITSLPRRLSLDFTDLTEDKLPFETIGGDFRIDFGNAWTCDLSLEGEVADMAIIGRAGIRDEDYDQVAVVRPQLSNLMPVPAAFLGGPTVGIAALLVSQIFREPLSGIGETYYTIGGSWEDTRIEPVDRDELDTTAFADCEAGLPALSPEEIEAIRELVAESEAADAQSAPQPAQENAPSE